MIYLAPKKEIFLKTVLKMGKQTFAFPFFMLLCIKKYFQKSAIILSFKAA